MLLESLIRVDRVQYDRPCAGREPIVKRLEQRAPLAACRFAPSLPLQRGRVDAAFSR
jgi:hypothetical protein